MAMQVSMANFQGDLKSFMQAFGHSNRNTVARPLLASPLQPIMMMQSPVVQDRVLVENGSRARELLIKYTDGEVVEEMFYATLGRQPSPSEKDVALTAMAKNRVEGRPGPSVGRCLICRNFSTTSKLMGKQGLRSQERSPW